MNEKEKLELVIENLYNTISNLSDTRDILMQNENTKKYIDDFDKMQKQYQKNKSIDEINKADEVLINFEQSVSIASFLSGFQSGIKTIKTLEDKNFSLNMLNLLV